MKKSGMKIWLVLFMVMGMLLGMAGSAAAKVPSAPIPPTKTPNSERFDISGFLKSSSSGSADAINAQFSGGGAISGQDLQEDVTISIDVPNGGAGAVGPFTSTTSIIVAGGKSYLKTSGLGSGNDKWYEVDSGLGSAGGLGTSITSTTGLDSSLSDAYTVTQVGKEAVNGAPTTKYRIDVDYQKLAAASGLSSTAGSTNVESDFKYAIFVWIGDNDMYLHKMMIAANGTSTSEDVSVTLALELTLTFRDFDTPITITAPPNAEKLDVSSLGDSSTASLLGGGTLVGMPTGVASGVEMGMPKMGAGMAGMPKTGRNTEQQMPLVPLAALGLLLLTLGSVARRVSVPVRH